MGRFGELVQLKEAVKDLLRRGLDVIDIVNQLRESEQFAGIIYEQVQAFYNILHEEANAAYKNACQFGDYQFQILYFKHYITGHEQELAEHEEGIAEYQRRIADDQEVAAYENEYANAQRRIFELEFLSNYQREHQQNSNKFLIYDESFVDLPDFFNFWEERFFMTMIDADNGACTFKVQDFFQGTEKSFAFQVADYIDNIYALELPFVLLCESNNENFDAISLHLAEFDFESESLRVVQSFEFNNRYHILVNASDSSKFLMCKGKALNECNLVGNRVDGRVEYEIQFDKKIILESDFNADCSSYFDEKLFALDFVVARHPFKGRKLTQIKMLCYDLERNEHSTYDLHETPEIFDCYLADYCSSAWIRDTVFFTVKLDLLKKYGVIFTNSQTLSWKIVEFGLIDSSIRCIQSVDHGNLLICAEDRKKHGYERKIYKLQMRKPGFLRNMAWMALVKLFKEAKVEDPYKEAREYLPLNSELHPFKLTEN